MALQPDYTAGTITLTNGSAAFTGTGTGWLAGDYREGDWLLDIAGGDNRVAIISAITGNGAGTLTKPWEGPTLTGVAYRLRVFDAGDRLTGQTRNMVDLLGNGNLQSMAAVTGPGVVVMDGPHSVTTEPRTNFINGVAFDVQVDLLADRAAYDGQSSGFAVLVSNIGDGRSAVYSKASNTVGDWTDPAYVTGPVGPAVDLEFSAVSLPPGSTPTVVQTPTVGGYDVDLGIPEGRGAAYAGAYNPATAYVLDDAVLDNGSTWIALGPTTGNAPPTLPTTSNAFWSLLARRGVDGVGTGDVVGPASASNNAFAVFADTTGKLIKTITYTAATALLNVFGGDAGSGGLKGMVPAPAAGDAAAGKMLGAGGAWKSPIPPGVIIMRFGVLMPGFISWGEGGTFNRTTYPELASWLDANGADLGLTAPQIAAGTIPDWRDYSPRTAGGALGPALGQKQEDAMQGHRHGISISNTFIGSGGSDRAPGTGTVNTSTDPVTDSVNGTPRTSSETRVKSFGVRWQIKT